MLVGDAAGFLVLGGIYFTAWLVGPVFLALIIVIAISPVQSWLLRRGWPGWLTHARAGACSSSGCCCCSRS